MAPRGLPRSFDAAAATAGLILTAPILALAALAVRWTSPGPALFRQVRVGQDGEPFTLLKLRSMTTANSGLSVTSAGDLRITPVGRFLRRTKIDELPQLWNVLRGDMALVGPRPEVSTFVDKNSSDWQIVLATRPGITDPITLVLRDEEKVLAASGGDPELFYRQVLLPWKLAGYAAYQRRRTWRSDLGVLIATVGRVLWPSSAPEIPSDLLVRRNDQRETHKTD